MTITSWLTIFQCLFLLLSSWQNIVGAFVLDPSSTCTRQAGHRLNGWSGSSTYLEGLTLTQKEEIKQQLLDYYGAGREGKPVVVNLTPHAPSVDQQLFQQLADTASNSRFPPDVGSPPPLQTIAYQGYVSSLSDCRGAANRAAGRSSSQPSSPADDNQRPATTSPRSKKEELVIRMQQGHYFQPVQNYSTETLPPSSVSSNIPSERASPTLATTTPAGLGLDWNQKVTKSVTSNMNVENDMNVDLELDRFQEKCLRMLSTEVGVKKFLGQNTHSLSEIPLDVIFGRFIDTIEDAIVHLRRIPYKWGLSEMPDDDDVKRPTVVVLGTGWAAHAFVKVACTFDLRVIVVSPVNHFVFTPMLASAAVGTVEYRSMTEAIRNSNPTISNYIEGHATTLNVENREVTIELAEPQAVTRPHKLVKLKYDHLLCAVGTGVRSSMVPGATKHCFNLKTAVDSKMLRTAIGEALEYASLPDVCGSDPASVEERRRRVRFVIIGGGPTGVELAGELQDFFDDICRPRKGAYKRLADDVSITLVHGGADLLPQFDKSLRAIGLDSLRRAGVDVRLNTRVLEVGENFVKLKKKGSDVEEVIPNGLTVWAAGNEPVPFIKELLSKLPESAAGTGGRVNVDRWLRCPTPTPETLGSILILGDAACLQTDPNDESSTLPQTAQVAGQQGAFAARLLNRGYDMCQTPPRLTDGPFDEFSKHRIWLLVRGLEEAPMFTFLNLGLLAYVGGGEALTQVQLGDVPLFNYAGNVAFALWRSVYLVKQVATRNRVLVTFDWAKSELFGRDITRL